MTLEYDKVWDSMNDLSNTITNFIQVKELLETYNRDENNKFLECVITLLEFYINEQDKKFNIAWSNTVAKNNPNDLQEKEDKVKKWILPVDDNYKIKFPEDLINCVGWKDGDILLWEDNNDGSFTLRKK